MTGTPTSGGRADDERRTTAVDPGPLARAAARCGQAAVGIVYVATGALAVAAAADHRMRAAGVGGAVAALRSGWGGEAATAAVVAGLAVYAVWLLADAVFDLHGDGACGGW